MQYDFEYPLGWKHVTSMREARDSNGTFWQVEYQLPGHVVVRTRTDVERDWSNHSKGWISVVVPKLARRFRDEGEFALVGRLGLRVKDDFRYLMAGIRPEAHCLGWSEWENDQFGQRRYEGWIEPDGRGHAVGWTRLEVEYAADEDDAYMPQHVVDSGMIAPEFDTECWLDVCGDLLTDENQLGVSRGYRYSDWTNESRRKLAGSIWQADTDS